MAKELPYFKFEPNQWENGNIQICTREDKGLFLDLCSMYWSRLGDVPFKLAVQKLCVGNASAFDSLINEGIFTVIDNDICIDFLNEQLSEFDNISEQNSKAAKKRWENHRKQKELSERNASALIPQCEDDAIREEKRREDKKIYSKIDFFNDWNKTRTEVLNKPSHLNRLDFESINTLNGITKDFKNIKLEMCNALKGFFKQETFPNGQDYTTNAKHFLNHFSQYSQAYYDKNSNIYGKK